jgi:hypothetical protein
MIPSAVVFLDRMPLGSSGKVDRNALLKPELHITSGSVPPSGSIETALAEIWRDALGLEAVGALDDYSALGGILSAR